MKQRNHKMKTTSLHRVALFAATSVALTWALNAADLSQSPPPPKQGQGRLLTPEQRQERHQQIQAIWSELQARKAAGTLTAEEQAWLNQIEQRGGRFVHGTPGQPGPACTAEECAARQQALQQWLVDLRAKTAAGTITPEELAQLDRFEFLGRTGTKSVPHGPRWTSKAGAGPGPGRGFVRGPAGLHGQGRGVVSGGTSPAVNPPPATPSE
jgi:hypothetical protein